jgi:drug/metabolite transporter (DMT)-like permease
VLGERLTRRIVCAVALGAAAVTLLMVPSFEAYAQAPLGMGLGLLAGLGWAIGTLILKRSGIAVSAMVLTGWQLLICAVPTTIGALLLGDWQWFMPSTMSIAVILYIAVVPMAIGNLCWFSIVGLLPANVAGLSAILVPVVAMIAGAILHAEPLGALQWLAMACSVGALSLVLLKPAPPQPALP